MQIGITERGDAAFHWDTVLGACGRLPGVIAITKSPDRIAERDMPDNLIVHCTITGLGGTYYEPHVPSPKDTLEAYQRILARIGPERAVLRVDPIFPNCFETHLAIAEATEGRLRVSFVDAYPHARARFRTLDTDPFPWQGTHAPLSIRQDLLRQLPENAEVCGEPGMTCTGCVSARDLAAIGLPTGSAGRRGQRAACACLAAKTEILNRRGQCPHSCLYCYWR